VTSFFVLIVLTRNISLCNKWVVSQIQEIWDLRDLQGYVTYTNDITT
jgi:hypothetical protein